MKGSCWTLIPILGFLMILANAAGTGKAIAAERQPWNDPEHALVIDAYELNIIDWDALLQDTRINGFISKASDGMPADYACKSSDHSGDTVAHCKTMWRKYAVSRELFRARRLIAKSNGMLWGSYHLARPGNPIEQANHFLDYANPQPDELMALDIDGMDPNEFMSPADAEIFVIHIKERTGRYPVLYANGTVAKYIADHHGDYPVLSRLPLWYARYKPDVEGTFPLGNWTNYAMWQFSSAENCTERNCPYRVPGTLTDIDVNMAPMTKAQLATIWPRGDLLPERMAPPSLLASKPETAVKEEVTALNYQSY